MLTQTRSGNNATTGQQNANALVMMKLFPMSLWGTGRVPALEGVASPADDCPSNYPFGQH